MREEFWIGRGVWARRTTKTDQWTSAVNVGTIGTESEEEENEEEGLVCCYSTSTSARHLLWLEFESELRCLRYLPVVATPSASRAHVKLLEKLKNWDEIELIFEYDCYEDVTERLPICLLAEVVIRFARTKYFRGSVRSRRRRIYAPGTGERESSEGDRSIY